MLYDGRRTTRSPTHRGPARAHDPARRLLEDVRDDRLAARLRGAAEPLVEPITRLIINSVSCTAPACSWPASPRSTGPRDEVDAMMAEFDERREIVVDGPQRAAGRELHRRRRARSTPSRTSSATGLDTRELGNRAARRGRRRGALRARPSASTARATCASRTRTRSRTSRRRWRRWATCSRRTIGLMAPRIVVTRPRPRAGARDPARSAGELWVSPHDRPPDGATSCTPPSRAPTRVVTLLHDRVDERLPRRRRATLRVVANVAVGYDNVDVAACSERGVRRHEHARAC